MRRLILLVPLAALFASISGLVSCGATEGVEEGGEATPRGEVEGGSVDDASFSDGEPPTDASVPPQRPPFDWVGVVGTGQSLSVGARAVEVVSKSWKKAPPTTLRYRPVAAALPPEHRGDSAPRSGPALLPLRLGAGLDHPPRRP